MHDDVERHVGSMSVERGADEGLESMGLERGAFDGERFGRASVVLTTGGDWQRQRHRRSLGREIPEHRASCPTAAPAAGSPQGDSPTSSFSIRSAGRQTHERLDVREVSSSRPLRAIERLAH